MSEFFPPINLQGWINLRWKGDATKPYIPGEADAKELLNVRVIFSGDELVDGPNGKARKTRVIRGISDESVSGTKVFKPKKTDPTKKEEVKVFDHMRTCE